MATATAILDAAIEPVVTGTLATLASAAIQNATAQRSWYVINQTNENEATIKVYEDIGYFGISAKRFADDLEKIEAKTIHVRLNSYGGEAFDGIAIFNALRAHAAEIIVHVDGIAASAASIIAMAGDEIRMADNAFLMIHEGRGGVFGEADDMRQYAEVLDKLNDSIAMTYQQRAGKTRKYWRDKMAEETWFTAEEAKKEGLADKIDDRESQAENRFDFKVWNHVKHVPEAVLKAWGKQPNQQAPENSPRGESPPAVIQQEKPNMADTVTQAAPASTPAAVATSQNPQGGSGDERTRIVDATNVSHFENGRKAGVEEGRKAELDRLNAILNVCPDKAMALDAFKAGQSAKAVQLAYEAKVKAENEARERESVKDLEILRLRQLIAAGGHSGVEMGVKDGGEEVDEGIAPRIVAEREWEHKPAVRKGFSSKENYVNFREMELTGHAIVK